MLGLSLSYRYFKEYNLCQRTSDVLVLSLSYRYFKEYNLCQRTSDVLVLSLSYRYFKEYNLCQRTSDVLVLSLSYRYFKEYNLCHGMSNIHALSLLQIFLAVIFKGNDYLHELAFILHVDACIKSFSLLFPGQMSYLHSTLMSLHSFKLSFDQWFNVFTGLCQQRLVRAVLALAVEQSVPLQHSLHGAVGLHTHHVMQLLLFFT